MAFRAVLDAANRVSAERGPTNAALGRNASGAAARDDRFRSFRRASDDALDAVRRVGPFGTSLAALEERLAAARREVDRLLDRPRAEREPEAVERAIEAMFSAYDAAQPLLDTAMTALLADDPQLVGHAMVARMLGEMRDYAGRLGSHLVIAIAQTQPPRPAQQAAFEQTRGRVLQLWPLIGQQASSSREPAIVEAGRAVERDFIQRGMALIDATLARLRKGDFDLTPESFTREIVPHFVAIERLRDAFVDSTIRQLDAGRHGAQRALVLASLATLLALAVELLLLLAGRQLLFRPLLSARRHIVRLADNRLDPAVAPAGLRGEMRELFQALETLRARLIERDEIDAERNRLEAQLKQLADTDGLTGVLNRGALERMVPRLARTDTGVIGLILLDLDHFKAVNDRHGHAAGDEVLRLAAARLRNALRQGDVVARFGGEEFAILTFDPLEGVLADIAERLRQVIEAKPFRLPDGSETSITASLGVARAKAAPDVWAQLLQIADAALYEAKERGRNRVVAGAAAG